jgi:hypothetical protein
MSAGELRPHYTFIALKQEESKRPILDDLEMDDLRKNLSHVLSNNEFEDKYSFECVVVLLFIIEIFMCEHHIWYICSV